MGKPWWWQSYIKQLSADFKALMISSTSYFNEPKDQLHFTIVDEV